MKVMHVQAGAIALLSDWHASATQLPRRGMYPMPHDAVFTASIRNCRSKIVILKQNSPLCYQNFQDISFTQFGDPILLRARKNTVQCNKLHTHEPVSACFEMKCISFHVYFHPRGKIVPIILVYIQDRSSYSLSEQYYLHFILLFTLLSKLGSVIECLIRIFQPCFSFL